MSYRPDKWHILKIPDEDEPLYKVFGMWKGGYLNGDSWRLNSGIESFKDDGEDGIQFFGYSGSEYVCYGHNEGLTVYGLSVLSDVLQAGEMELIDYKQFKEEWNER